MKLDDSIFLDYWELKEEVFYPFDSSQIDRYHGVYSKEEIIQDQQRLELIKAHLSRLPRNVLLAYKEALLDELGLLIELLEKSMHGRRISRNQALIIDNAAYATIIRAIKSTLKFGFPSKPGLFRTKIEKDMFDVKPLVTILRNYERKLKTLKDFDFFVLEDVTDNLIEAINEQWQEDNKAMRQLHKV
ncbi:MAG: hypothetical protein AAGC88_05240 [Bacteroidota bacterium]